MSLRKIVSHGNWLSLVISLTAHSVLTMPNMVFKPSGICKMIGRSSSWVKIFSFFVSLQLPRIMIGFYSKGLGYLMVQCWLWALGRWNFILLWLLFPNALYGCVFPTCHRPCGLCLLVSKSESLVRLDECTELLVKGRYARVSIEIDLSSSLIPGTEITLEGLNVPSFC